VVGEGGGVLGGFFSVFFSCGFFLGPLLWVGVFGC